MSSVRDGFLGGGGVAGTDIYRWVNNIHFYTLYVQYQCTLYTELGSKSLTDRYISVFIKTFPATEIITEVINK